MGRKERKWTLDHRWWTCKLVQILCKNRSLFLKRLKTEIQYGPGFPSTHPGTERPNSSHRNGSRRQAGYQEEPSRKAGLWIPLYSAALPRSSTRGQENSESGVRGQSELSRGDPVFIKTKATNKIPELRSPGVLSVVEWPQMEGMSCVPQKARSKKFLLCFFFFTIKKKKLKGCLTCF